MRIIGPPNNASPPKAHGADAKAASQAKEAQATAQHEVQAKPPSTPPAPALAVVVSAEAKAADVSRTRLESEVEKRIQTVKAQIEGGTYRIDPDRLAAKLVDEESARGGKK